MASKKSSTKKASAPKPNGDYRLLDRTTEMVEVELSDAEIRERATKAAELREHRDHLVEERANVAKRMKTQIDSADAQIGQLLAAVHRGVEEREVECEVRITGENVDTVRLDTLEVLRSRKATDEERQETMLGGESENEAANA